MSGPKTPEHTLDVIRRLVGEGVAIADLKTEREATPLDIVRHLLDVVGRQRRMLERLEWSAGRRVYEAVCPRCKNHRAAGHTTTCALDALLRETR